MLLSYIHGHTLYYLPTLAVNGAYLLSFIKNRPYHTFFQNFIVFFNIFIVILFNIYIYLR